METTIAISAGGKRLRVAYIHFSRRYSYFAFYTAENVKSPYVINTKTQVAVPLFISDKEATLKTYSFLERAIGIFLFVGYTSLNLLKKEVEEWLPANIAVFIY